MTALCGGGTSGVKAGLATVVDVSLGALAQYLTARNLRWLIPSIPLTSLPPITLSSFCATDPPAMPTFTLAETTAILGLGFGADFDSGLSKLRDMLLHTIWYEMCQCTSGTPVAYTPPSMPANTPVQTQPSPGTNAACASWGPQTVTSFVGPSFALSTSQPIKYVVLTVTNTIFSGGGRAGNCALSMWMDDYPTPGPGTLLSSTNVTIPIGQTTQVAIPCPVGTNFVRPDFTLTGGSGSSTFVYTLEGFCQDASPGAVNVPCCPPDAATAAQLDLILQMVTLIQRQSVPFAYIYGSNHTGLSGDGEISPVSGLLGVSVDVTTLPASYGRSVGTPEHLYGLGFVTLGSADGWSSSRPIDADGSLMLPGGHTGAYTRIGYSLSPGVIVDIRELVREP